MAEHKIVMRNGLFHVASYVDKHGMPQVPSGTPGFHDRKLAIAWADKQAAGPDPEPVEEAAAPEPDPIPDPVQPDPAPGGDVTVQVPTGEVKADGEAPQVTND